MHQTLIKRVIKTSLSFNHVCFPKSPTPPAAHRKPKRNAIKNAPPPLGVPTRARNSSLPADLRPPLPPPYHPPLPLPLRGPTRPGPPEP